MPPSPAKQPAGLITERRAFFRSAGAATLSATAVALIAGCESMAQGSMKEGSVNSSSTTMADVDILNVALGLEHEAINAYQLGAESGLLQPPVLNTAVAFQNHHKEHRDALLATIRKLGGMPVAEKPKAEYAQAFNASTLRNQADVLKLAQRLERGAATPISASSPPLVTRRWPRSPPVSPPMRRCIGRR